MFVYIPIVMQGKDTQMYRMWSFFLYLTNHYISTDLQLAIPTQTKNHSDIHTFFYIIRVQNRAVPDPLEASQ